MIRVLLTERARSHLKNLPEHIAIRIEEKLFWFASQAQPLQFAEPLQGFSEKVYRFRIGDYRAVFRIDKGKVTVLMVLAVQHRKDVYR